MIQWAAAWAEGCDSFRFSNSEGVFQTFTLPYMLKTCINIEDSKKGKRLKAEVE